MSALARYVVFVPGVATPVHVYAPDGKSALRTGADELGLRALPFGSNAIPVFSHHTTVPPIAA